nr:MAG TPA: hypothetical protein [Crassvirales sp.]
MNHDDRIDIPIALVMSMETVESPRMQTKAQLRGFES